MSNFKITTVAADKKNAREKLARQVKDELAWQRREYMKAKETIARNKKLVSELIRAGIVLSENYDPSYGLTLDCVTLERVTEVRKLVGAFVPEEPAKCLAYYSEYKNHPDCTNESNEGEQDWVKITLEVADGPFAGLRVTYCSLLTEDSPCKVVEQHSPSSYKTLVCSND